MQSVSLDSPESTSSIQPDLKHSKVSFTPTSFTASKESLEKAPPANCQSPESAPPISCQSPKDAPPSCQSPDNAPPTDPSLEDAPFISSKAEDEPRVPVLNVKPEEDDVVNEVNERLGFDVQKLSEDSEGDEELHQEQTCDSTENQDDSNENGSMCESVSYETNTEVDNVKENSTERPELSSVDDIKSEFGDNETSCGVENHTERGDCSDEMAKETLQNSDHNYAMNPQQISVKPKHVDSASVSEALAVNLQILSVEDTMQSASLGTPSGSEFSSPQRTVNHSCSPYPTPRPLKSFSEDIEVSQSSQLIEKETVRPTQTMGQETSSQDSIDVACSPIIIGTADFQCFHDEQKPARRRLSATEEFGAESGSDSDSIASSPRILVDAGAKKNENGLRSMGIVKTLFDSPQKINAAITSSVLETEPKVQMNELAESTTEVNVQDSVAEMQALKITADANCGTTPIRLTSCHTETYPKVEMQSTSTCYTPVQTKSSACGQDEISQTSQNVGTSPKETHSISTSCTPIQSKSLACGNDYDEISQISQNVGTTPVHPKETSTMVTPVRLVSTATCQSPTVRNDMASNTISVETSDTGSTTDMISTGETATMVTPIRCVSKATCRSPTLHTDMACNTNIETSEAGIATDLVTMAQRGTMVTPVKTCESGVGCEATVTMETGTAVTPVKLQGTSTAMTPLQYRQTNIYSMVSWNTSNAKTRVCTEVYTVRITCNHSHQIMVQTFLSHFCLTMFCPCHSLMSLTSAQI